MSAESGNILIWNRLTEQLLFKEEQPGVKQITLLDNGQRFLAISKPPDGGAEVTRINATIVTRTIPGKPQKPFLIIIIIKKIKEREKREGSANKIMPV